ncbi:MAG: anthranilate phosphoribosyltransferase, partial [Pseudomonadota bacterium]
VSDWANGELTTYSIHPSELGMATASLAEIKGGKTAPEAAAQLRLVLSGKAGPCLDMVLLNAAAALMAAGRTGDLAGGVALAREVVASGAALNKVEALVAFSRSVKKT